MLLIRRISPLISVTKSNLSTSAPKNAEIVKEIVKNVDPYSRIRIHSAMGVTIRPYDLHDCPDSNILRVRVSSNLKSPAQGDANIQVEVNEKDVDIVNTSGGDDFACVLEVPIKADLHVDSKDSVSIAEMYSDHIKVAAQKDVSTKNLRSTSIDLMSFNGDVTCNGLILAHTMGIHTENSGNIFLDKLQGDILHVKTLEGNIETNSCYVESSNFVTDVGKLNLRNIHKTAEIYILNKGDLDMRGIHGNVYIKTNGGDLNLQFSEISGDNIIMANDSENVAINISDVIQNTSFVEIHSDEIVLNESASHLAQFLDNPTSFRMGKEELCQNKLLICTKGKLTLGKMSWADSMKQMMHVNDL